MKATTITKQLNIKEALFKKEGGKERYNKLLEMCEKSDELIETLQLMGFSLLQSTLVIDIILLERKRVEQTIYKGTLIPKTANTAIN